MKYDKQKQFMEDSLFGFRVPEGEESIMVRGRARRKWQALLQGQKAEGSCLEPKAQNRKSKVDMAQSLLSVTYFLQQGCTI